ncbi:MULTISPECIES: M23 family metallopeptidase [Gilliamella]|uniref:Peptidoglycan DD-metalloendopeptidase family protein n=1 Tax=Gilliamella apicola TaxID=1196095 RepID=A0A556S986_9GAMM|nr:MULTISPECIES: M23 family metallopeptidase [Gilliamella]MBI0096078.1 peptidoglycan DD-metalloendopeptidase family protein [Gilliamella sp. W8136]TSJ97703.1 peptidoglycan DD-metalloendopeptidase family protein [Gilliamella apicola]
MSLSAVKEWKFPVIINSKKDLTVNNYYSALLKASKGFYPISINQLIHMGIHFDKTVLKELGDENERQVHCIADGEVVAYRINDNYQNISYGDTVAFYSTGFVLVRHLLEMERVEEKTESTEPDTENSSTTEKPAEDNSPASSASKTNDTATSTNSTADKADTTSENTPTEPEKEKLPPHQLYFYSLYMHLADTAFYDKNSKTSTPSFWEQDIYRVLPDHKELNKVEGLCIRDKADNSKNDSILAVLQVGTKVNLNLNLHDENHNWYAVTSLAEGYSSIPELKSIKHTQGEAQTDILGWIFIGKEMTSQEFEILELNEHKKLLSGQSTELSILTKEFNATCASSKGLRVRKDKKILSMLPGGTQVKISGNKKAKHFVELTEVIRDGKPTIPLPKENTKIWFDCLERISRGKEYNEVVVLDTPSPIKAGDLIGHIGHDHTPKISLSQNNTEIKCETNLHVECFTCDDLPNFIALTQAEASKLPEEEKTLLGISKQAKLLKSPKDADTDVGQHTEIKVISKDINVKWLQIEITASKTKKKTVWIENSEEISKSINAKGNISLATDKKAWSEYPLQASALANNSSIIDTPLLLDINNGVFKKLSHRAIDKDGILWIFIEHALDKNNAPIRGWLAINSEGVKKVSCWDWFDFKLIEEKATTKEFYLDVKKSLSRDNTSLGSYKPTLKETLTILDRQYHLDQKKYAKIDAKSFNGITDKPQLSSALSRLLIKSESEWYSEIDAQGKIPKWDALDSEFNEKAKKVLSYLEDGDSAKCDAYISTLAENERESVKRGLELKRRELQAQGINNNKTIQDFCYTELKQKVALWDNEKEKIKKMLWWDDVAKGLAKQNQQNKSEQSKTNNESNSSDITLPATLNLDGQASFIHPMMLINYFKIKASPWHEPLKNPQRTRYNSSKDDRPWNGAYGLVRNGGERAHAGLDIFARIGTPCYACLDGEIVKFEDQGDYGKVIVLKVKGDDLRASRNNYTLEFSGKEKNEITQAVDFDINSDYFYIRYCHVHDTKKVPGIKVGSKVKAGDHIGYTSDTGNAKNLPNTHLHLEIAMKPRYNRSLEKNEKDKRKMSLGYKINPAFFVNLNPIDEADQKDAVKKGNKYYKQN